MADEKLSPLYEITLKFRVDFKRELPAGFNEKLAEKITHFLSDSEDGRKRFDTEMVEKALSELLESAARATYYRAFCNKYGREMVDSKTGLSAKTIEETVGKSLTSRASWETEVITQGLVAWLYNEPRCVSVEKLPEDGTEI